MCPCFAISADHAWFYNVESVKRSLPHQTMSNNNPIVTQPRVAVDFESKRSEYRTWKAWCFGCRTAGCYDGENLAEIRLHFLNENISPKVTYCNGELRALHISNFNQHIYKRPQYALSLQSWSEELNHHGHDVPYRGESAASYTHQVIMALVKNKREKKVSRQERFTILEEYGNKCQICGDRGTNFQTIWNSTTQYLCAIVATVNKS